MGNRTRKKHNGHGHGHGHEKELRTCKTEFSVSVPEAEFSHRFGPGTVVDVNEVVATVEVEGEVHEKTLKQLVKPGVFIENETDLSTETELLEVEDETEGD